MSKILYLDVESTGLYSPIHGIHELSAIVEIEGEVVDTFSEKCRIYKTEECDTKSLKIQKLKESELRSKDRQHPRKMYRNFIEFLSQHVDPYDREDKFTVIGYNIIFDLGFIESFFDKAEAVAKKSYGFGPYQDFQPVDVLSLIRYFRLNDIGWVKSLDNLRLNTVANHFNVEHKDVHDSFMDIEATRLIYKKVQEELK